MSAFLIVSHVRLDGGVGQTTFIGYGAERCAFRDAAELEAFAYVRYVAVVQREGEGPEISWDLRREWFAKATGEA